MRSIEPQQAEEIRAAIARGRTLDPDAPFVTGSAHSWETEDGQTASGRARCLCCGRKIVQGEPCLRAVYVGGEPWTSSVRFLHREACPAPQS
jgi:hypothetical protein